MEQARIVMRNLVNNIEKAIVGKRQMIERLVVALSCDSHVLIEDVPGVGKTTLVSALAKSIDGKFSRIQFTPDVMPSDITGFSMYNPKTNAFEYRSGAVMTHFLLADEINRTPPKTQSSLLEAMEEKSVSIDGHTYELPKPFMVMATQNPIEYLGTYPLPEAQIDRFIMKLSIGYPPFKDEINILRLYEQVKPIERLESVASCEDIIRLQQKVREVYIHDTILHYIVTLVSKTRNCDAFLLGASPRGSLYLSQAAKAWALYSGRTYVIPDDVKYVYLPVMAHRVLLRNEAKFEKITIEDVLNQSLEEVGIPTGDFNA